MSTEDTLMKALFAQQRAQILHMKITAPRLIEDSYAYAWETGVYPVFHDGDESVPDMPHENFEELFITKKSLVNEVLSYLDDHWGKETSPSFYKLEEEFEGRDNRLPLINICRYIHLSGRFDDRLWEKLLEGMHHPAEASGILMAYSADNIAL